MKIKTHHDYPPIPNRSFDWSAIDDDTYDGAPDSKCPVGHGATEQEAIEDLLDQLPGTYSPEQVKAFLEQARGYREAMLDHYHLHR
jgi:hypothetical protein